MSQIIYIAYAILLSILVTLSVIINNINKKDNFSMLPSDYTTYKAKKLPCNCRGAYPVQQSEYIQPTKW